MKFYLFYIFLLIGWLTCTEQAATHISNPSEAEAQILLQCLDQTDVADNIIDKLKKVASYSKWTVEEVPCFTRCIAAEKGWLNIDNSTWNKDRLVTDLGADIYNYCRFELDRKAKNGCEFAYNGLKCLKQAEKYTVKTLTTLVSCAKLLNVSTATLREYAKFPPDEVVPCLFQCFADKMKLYTPRFEWEFENWAKAFGPMKEPPAASAVCKKNPIDFIGLKRCDVLYQEYLCLEHLNYNTNGINFDIPNDTTTVPVLTVTEIEKT